MEWKLFGSTFALIFIAELPDKTAFVTLLLATRHRPFAVFAGAALAFVIQSLVAVLLGSILRLVAPALVHEVAGILFLIFALIMWFRNEEKEENAAKDAVAGTSRRLAFWKSAGAAFIAIFFAEWGDLTQLATATLATKYHAPVVLFLAATSALWTVTALGAYVGHHAGRWLQPDLLKKAAALAFAAVGIWMLLKGSS